MHNSYNKNDNSDLNGTITLAINSVHADNDHGDKGEVMRLREMKYV